MRTIIDLPKEQIQALLALSKKEKKSRAALVREAVEHLLSQKIQPKDATQKRRAIIDATFGMWQGEARVDGVEYQQTLRSEWDEREENLWAPYRSKQPDA